jgi:large exoprotein involved in heme utilization and adhesion
MTIDGQRSVFFTGIATQADHTSSGAGGRIEVTVPGALSIADGGAISSRTFGRGAAGSITIHAGTIAADARGSPFPTGILADSDAEASGMRAGWTFP